MAQSMITKTVIENEGINIKNVAKLNVIEFSGEDVNEDNIKLECHAMSRDWITVSIGSSSFTIDFRELILTINQMRDLTSLDEQGTTEERHTAHVAKMYLDQRRFVAMSGGRRPPDISRAAWYKMQRSKEEELQAKISDKLAKQRREEAQIGERVRELMEKAKAEGIELTSGKKLFKKADAIDERKENGKDTVKQDS